MLQDAKEADKLLFRERNIVNVLKKKKNKTKQKLYILTKDETSFASVHLVQDGA